VVVDNNAAPKLGITWRDYLFREVSLSERFELLYSADTVIATGAEVFPV